MPCPLCLLGFDRPHTQKDWDTFASSVELKTKLNKILDELREEDWYSEGGALHDPADPVV